LTRTFLDGASLVLPDRVADGQTVVIEDGRIVDLVSGPRELGEREVRADLSGRLVVPGFIDVHVHGVGAIDVLDGPGAVAAVAERLPAYGVTAFCPTSVACPPAVLATFLEEVALARAMVPTGRARVLPAHLESNFISPDYRGAQPLDCLRTPVPGDRLSVAAGAFTADEILAVIARHHPDIGIVSLAPELPGGMDLVRALAGSGLRVSLGHTGASYDEALAAISAGARHATHLFNRMRPMTHRDPGLVGAVLASDDVAAEIICDGRHVHPAVVRIALAAKSAGRLIAISDGTAGSGLPAGSRAHLGGREIVVEDVARLDDGTMAGSVATMARVFTVLVTACDVDVVRAAEMCATTPARELGLVGFGVIAPGAVADLTVLNDRFDVVETWIDGKAQHRAIG
jgi:N-acetylglucosamine-6-phosphate deacetylase